MPYITNPDIAVFPAMPKRHSDLLKFYSNTMAPADKIWWAFELVWRELNSASINWGLILMHHITSKFVAHKGTNTFPQTHDIYSGVRNSFANTPDGINPKVNVLDWMLCMHF